MVRPIALLCGAAARTSKGGPDVGLAPGTYSIEVYGRVDSELSIYFNGKYLMRADTGAIIKVESKENVQVRFEKRGTEEMLTILAKKVA